MTLKTKNNKTKILPPTKSVRQYCLWCCNGSTKAIKECPSNSCVLYPFRMGKKTIKGSVIKKIKQRCLDCGEKTAQSVRICAFDSCPLFPYRNGKSPAHQKLWANRRPAWVKEKNLPYIYKK